MSKRNQFSYAARPVTSTTPHIPLPQHVARLVAQARRRLLRLRCASGCLGTSRGLSRGSSRCLSSTTPPRAGSSSTTSLPLRVWVPRHVARLVTRLVAQLVVDYSASRKLVVDNSASRWLVIDYFASAARPGASARREACHAARRAARRRLLCLVQARCRLLCLRRTSGCTSPRVGSSSTTSPTPRVWVNRYVARLVTRLVDDFFDYAARLGSSARRAAHRAARRAARRRLLCLAQARRRLLHLRCASGCLGTSRGSSRGSSRRLSSTTPPHAGSSWTTSPAPRVRVHRHVARLVAPLVVDYSASRRLVVDYFASTTRPGASARRAARHAARHATRRRILRLA
jgi:hypothetical protein